MLENKKKRHTKQDVIKAISIGLFTGLIITLFIYVKSKKKEDKLNTLGYSIDRRAVSKEEFEERLDNLYISNLEEELNPVSSPIPVNSPKLVVSPTSVAEPTIELVVEPTQTDREKMVEAFKTYALEKWDKEYDMVRYEIDKQTEAYDWVMKQTEYSDIMERAKQKWGIEYDMVQYEYQKQVEAFESL